MNMEGRLPQDPPRPSSLGAGAGAGTGSAMPASSPRPAAAIASEDLFAGATEVQINHRGSLYRLKQTALGKLILTK
jgi:hemin uptake protein HemP